MALSLGCGGHVVHAGGSAGGADHGGGDRVAPPSGRHPLGARGRCLSGVVATLYTPAVRPEMLTMAVDTGSPPDRPITTATLGSLIVSSLTNRCAISPGISKARDSRSQ